MPDEKVRDKVEELIGGLSCPKNFRCCESESQQLCKAKDIGMESFLECLEKNPLSCSFSLSYADSYYCRCPLRVYLAKELDK
jgi:hypothetical protein